MTSYGISIHAPRVGGDPTRKKGISTSCLFQSTPPVWGATLADSNVHAPTCYFNPRPPCGGRHSYGLNYQKTGKISIHAPRVGGDALAWGFCAFYRRFQSTPPVWGATGGQTALPGEQEISIHAPRVGGDAAFSSTVGMSMLFQSTPPVWGATLPSGLYLQPGRIDFNPRPPCGGRH